MDNGFNVPVKKAKAVFSGAPHDVGQQDDSLTDFDEYLVRRNRNRNSKQKVLSPFAHCE